MRPRYSDLVGRIVPPLEAYVEGPPPEVEAAPLREEPLPPMKTRIEKLGERPKIPAAELVSIIEHLRTDTKEMTQLKVEFDGEVGWLVPSPRYTLYFRKPEGRVVDKLVGPRTPEQLKEHHHILEGRYGPKIERHYRPDVDVHYFWAFPPARKPIFRADPYLIAKEVVDLYPHRLTIQYVTPMIRPPIPIAPAELPWELRITPPPRYGR